MPSLLIRPDPIRNPGACPALRFLAHAPFVVSQSDPTDAEGIRKPQPGFKALGDSGRYDASGFVAALGLSSPPGSTASYAPSSGRLIVTDTRANLDRLNQIFASANATADFPLALRVAFSVFECDFPEPDPGSLPNWPSYADFVRLPASNKRLLGSISMPAAHGERVSLSNISGPSAKTKAKTAGDRRESSLDNGQFEVDIEYEAMIDNPDLATFTACASFRWRGAKIEGVTPDIQFTTQYSGWENYPQILQLSAVKDHPGRYLVVIGTCGIEIPESWTMENLKAAAAKIDSRPPSEPTGSSSQAPGTSQN